MEAWKKVWQEGIAPQLTDKALAALAKGLQEDDPRLLQGATTSPPSLECMAQWNVEAACALGYCGWKGGDLSTVEQVENYFARACFEADKRLGDPGLVRHFLNWFDMTPRPKMRRELLAEVNRVLTERATGVVPLAQQVA